MVEISMTNKRVRNLQYVRLVMVLDMPVKDYWGWNKIQMDELDNDGRIISAIDRARAANSFDQVVSYAFTMASIGISITPYFCDVS